MRNKTYSFLFFQALQPKLNSPVAVSDVTGFTMVLITKLLVKHAEPQVGK